jgi:undecaprenyl-diphosphatase
MVDAGITPVEAIVLGVVQGLTEFLPISSTAHLRVVPALLGWSDPGAACSAVIQLGSVIAVLTYFRKDLLCILKGTLAAIQQKDYGAQDLRIFGAICFGTLPICILGLLLKPLIEGPLRSLQVIGAAAIFMGLLLFLAERVATHKRGLESIGARDGLLVGLGQSLALIPGCSRSGSTLTVAMLLNMKRDEAARFSFLLGIPALILSGLLEFKEMMEAGMNSSSTVDLALGLIVSTIVSYAAIAWFMKYLKNHATWIFVAYRLIFGVAVIILSSLSIIH